MPNSSDPEGRPEASAEKPAAKRPTEVPARTGLFALLPVEFGRYRVERLLGKGTMGAVYLAFDTKLDRRVALKIPRTSSSGSQKLLKRLQTEAKAAARIDHPSACKVYDYGEMEGVCFIAMQYVEGESLRTHLDARPMSPAEAVALIAPLAEGLAKAHAAGIVHRDLKPENILIDRSGVPVIMDFGLAKLTTAFSAHGSTQAGTILGSPAYMSPEQAAGNIAGVDHRSDQYALGVILFEMLTGQWPFTGSSLEIMGRKSVRDAPSPQTVNPRLPASVAEVCRKMMARQSADRYPDMPGMLAALRQAPHHMDAGNLGHGGTSETVFPRAPTGAESKSSVVPREAVGVSSGPSLKPLRSQWSELPAALRWAGLGVAVLLLTTLLLGLAVVLRTNQATVAIDDTMTDQDAPPALQPVADATAITPIVLPGAKARPSPASREGSVRPSQPAAATQSEARTLSRPPVPGSAERLQPVPAYPKPVQKAAAQVATYRSPEGVVLAFNQETTHWHALGRRAPIDEEAILAVPPPFTGYLTLAHEREVTLLDGTLVRALGGSKGADSGWELKQGRMIVSSTDITGKRLGLEIRGDLWVLELQGKPAVIGVEVQPREPTKLEGSLTGHEFSGGIYVEAGALRVIDPQGVETIVDRAQWYSLLPSAERDADQGGAPRLGAPAWISEAARPGSRLSPAYIAEFEKTLSGHDTQPPLPADMSIRELLADKRSAMAQLAAETLCLLGAADPMTVCLRSEHAEVRRLGLHGIRAWLPQAPHNREALKAELSKRFAQPVADIAYTLLWGYSSDDFKSREVCQRLVGWLAHDDVAIRELAFYQLHSLTGKTFSYRPDGPPNDRQLSVHQWEAEIAKGPLTPAK